uniref:Putative toxin n=1 Tax=Pelinobius muticus TaxID=753628 RepID=D5J6Y3_PELMU|nr:putative toxin [Pelinobius muticus]
MNVILVLAFCCILALQSTVSHTDPHHHHHHATEPGHEPCVPLDRCRSPKIPGCCEFFEAFGKEMAELKRDKTQSCKRFPPDETEKREQCKMQKMFIARSKVEPSPECKERMEAFIQGTPPSTTTSP